MKSALIILLSIGIVILGAFAVFMFGDFGNGDTETESDTFTETQTEAEDTSDTEIELDSGTDEESNTDVENDTTTDSVTETEETTELETETATESEIESETANETETGTGVELESSSETDSQTEDVVDSETEHDSEDVETEIDSMTDTEAVTDTEADTETESDTTTDSQKESDTDLTSSTDAEIEAESDTTTDSQKESDTETATETDTETETEDHSHTEEIILALAPTCTEDGLTEGKKCSDCGEVLVEQTVLDAKGHIEETIPSVYPTCEETGLTKGKKCSVCGEILRKQVVLNAKGHKEEIIEGTEPTCIENGIGDGLKCTECDKVLLEQEELLFTGKHIYKDGKCVGCGKSQAGDFVYILNSDNQSYSISDIGTYTDVSVIVIPKAYKNLPVTAIKEFAFADCNWIEEIVFEKETNIKTIERYAFQRCTSLKEAIFEEGLIEIGELAFNECTSITQVHFPTTLKTLSPDALRDQVSLEKITVAEGNENFIVVDNVLYDNKQTNLIRYPAKREGTSFIIPKTVETVGPYAFYKCDVIENVTYEEGSALLALNYGAFQNCKNLKNIELPESLTSVWFFTFAGCASLESIMLPKNVSTILDMAFVNCPSLERIDVDPENKRFESADGVLYTKNKTAILCYPQNKKGQSYVVPGTVLVVGNSAFRATSLESVTLSYNTQMIYTLAFCDTVNLEELVIPLGVTTIEDYAFQTSGLKKIYCEAKSKPENWGTRWNYIRSSQNCEVEWGYNNITDNSEYDYIVYEEKAYLILYKGESTDVIVPETIDGYEVVSLGDAFKDNSKIKSVKIPNSVKTLGASAFSNCTSLASIDVPSSVTTTYETTFEGCPIENAVIPSYVSIPNKKYLRNVTINSGTLIGYQAFMNCTNLRTVKIANSVVSISQYAFAGCTSLQSVVFEDDSNLRTLANFAFYGCTYLNKIVMPIQVEELYDFAFDACPNLTIYCESAIIPLSWMGGWNRGSKAVETGYNNIKTNQDFDYVINNGQAYLTLYKGESSDVIIPEEIDGYKVASVGLIFNGDTNINSISLAAPHEKYTTENGVLYNSDKTILISYPAGNNNKSFEIPSTVITIKEGAFLNCASLESIVIEKTASLEYIEERAFENCSRLNEISLPNSLKILGDYAFYSCTALESIVIPGSVYRISVNCFYNCSSLKEVELQEGIERIDNYAFGATAIVSLKIPKGISYIGENAFSWCESLVRIEIATGVEYIGIRAFASVSSATIYCEDKEKPVAWHDEWNNKYSDERIPTVWDCKNNNIAEDGFIYVIADGVNYSIKDGEATVIDQPADIKEAIILETITVNDQNYTVKSIASRAFTECWSLERVIIPKSVKEIGSYAFYNCYSLCEVVIPSSVEVVDSIAFGKCNSLVVYCEPAEKPEAWADDWCGIYSIVWNCNENDIATDGYVYATIEGVRYAIKNGEAMVAKQSKFLSGEIVIPRSIVYKEITYPVTSIKEEAFIRCALITGVIIEDNIKSIGRNAFYNCTSLVFSEYDNAYYLGNKENPYYALIEAKDRSITECTVHSKTKLISKGAFFYCKSLEKVIIPDSVTIIDEKAFEHCTALKTVTMGKGVETINYGAFFYCDAIESVVLPKSLTNVGESAFIECLSITIYCEATEKPEDWHWWWNSSGRPVYWYSVDEPTTEGNYWHYVDGVVTIWE